MILKDLPIGTIVTDKKTKFNGKPIEWIVTDHEKYQDGTVLFSKDIICCKSFDNSKMSDYKKYKEHPICWENSTIRNWLKTNFFYNFFSIQLRCMSISVELLECDRNDLTRKIKDNIFLLSPSEIGYTKYKALQLFSNNEYKTAEACLGLKWSYWLRTPFLGNLCDAYIINSDGSFYHNDAYDNRCGIRPACVISDYAPIKKKENGDYKFDWLSLLKFD